MTSGHFDCEHADDDEWWGFSESSRRRDVASRKRSSKAARNTHRPSLRVVPQNILAAGVLDYVYNLGDRLGMLKLADALVLRWASGTFDAKPGGSSADLLRYRERRSKRVSPDERAMIYRQILAKGSGKILSDVSENTAFPNLWGMLMIKTADFLQRSQDKLSADRHVSRLPVYQATKQLQYNLTAHTTGISHVQITERYRHLLEAKSVLRHAVDYFSTGSGKSLWTVVERASREWFDEAPNISAIRSAAIPQPMHGSWRRATIPIRRRDS
jgi:hypothetical protein